MSLLRSIFNKAAVPRLFQLFSDDRVEVAYVNGDVCFRGIQGILRNERQEMLVDEFGDTLKRTLVELVICSDPNSPYGGVARPQLKAMWHLQRPHESKPTVWAVDSEPGRGISTIDGSFIVVHLVQKHVAVKGSPDLRLGM